ncbi:MAG: metal ABC transporter ATP-binding protein, partial [Deltaproteobacteria bacterium]
KTCSHCCTRIENLGVNISNKVILKEINLHINCGELVAIIGPNGAGKTTFLRAILGEIPHSGRINFQIGGAPRKYSRISYVPQKLNCDPDSPVSVLDFMVTGISGWPVWTGIGHALREKARSALEKVSAEHLLKRRIGELSGGELQRVLLAMAITPPPQLLLLDEPMSGVDVKGLSLFYGIVSDLRVKYDVSIVLVTHDLVGIAAHADYLVLLNQTILLEGSPEEVLSNEKLIRTLGPSLWNISKLPELNLQLKNRKERD